MKFAKQVIVPIVLSMLAVAMSACRTNDLLPPTATLIPTPVPRLTTISNPAPVPQPPTPTQVLPATTSPVAPTQTSTQVSPATTSPVAPTQTPTLVPTRAIVPTPTFTPTPTHKERLLAAFSNVHAKLKTYRAKIPEEGREIEVVLPDRLVQWGLDPIGQIGRTVYMYDARGQIRAVNVGYTITPLDRVNIAWIRNEFARSSQVTFLGPTTIDGTPCVAYSANVTISKITPSKTPGATPAITPIPQAVKIWFAVSDGFPRRFEMGPPTPVSVIFYDFNAPIEPFVEP